MVPLRLELVLTHRIPQLGGSLERGSFQQHEMLNFWSRQDTFLYHVFPVAISSVMLAYAGKRALTLVKTEESVVHGTSISKLRFWKCIHRSKWKHLPLSTANIDKIRTRRGTGSLLHMEKRTNRSIPKPSIQHQGLTKWQRERLPQALRQLRN